MKFGLIAIGKFIALAELQLMEMVEKKEAFEIRIPLFAWKVELVRSFSEIYFRGLE